MKEKSQKTLTDSVGVGCEADIHNIELVFGKSKLSLSRIFFREKCVASGVSYLHDEQ